DASRGPATGLQPGDVIEAVDDQNVADLVRKWRPWYAASNEPTRLRDMAASLTRGQPGTARLRISRAGTRLAVTALRVPYTPGVAPTHDRPGDTFQLLTGDVAYLKLSSVKSADIPSYLQRAAGTKVLVVDIRNYPSEFVVFTLGGHFVDRATPFARFTALDLSNPGAFTWRGPPVELQPLAPRYAGKVMVLVDEVSQSQAEYTSMAFRAAGATIVGSTTAGADGNVSLIPLPGGLRTMISGIGVFYPDKRPTQRVGIVPDLEVRPTIEGIRAGRDEVLEAAVSRALGQTWHAPTPAASSAAVPVAAALRDQGSSNVAAAASRSAPPQTRSRLTQTRRSRSTPTVR
ncbi:MAG TPA: S41 family peptidase, partial [Longimicrobiales bacterium]